MASYERHEVERRAWETPQAIRGRFAEAETGAFMRRAIANARRAGLEERTGWPFGALIVDRGGEVVADGSNHVLANFDPTAHAEVMAIRAACSKLQTVSLAGCVLYSSSEPCPMCLAAAYWAGVDGIVYAARAEDAAVVNGFDDAFLYRQFAGEISSRRLPMTEMLREEAVAVLKAFDADAR